jgi:large subunit ribosomal protein L10
MARAERQAAVAEIVDSFNDSAGAVLTDYRGLTVKELRDLRRSLGENADYAVVKNTLAKLAASEAGMAGFDELLVGPTAIAFLKGDVVEAAKGLRDFAKANPALIIKGGYLDGNPLDAQEVAKLADLESREVLLGKLAGAMLASLSQAVYLLNAPLAQAARLAGALQAKAEQDPTILAGGAGTPAAAEDAPVEEASPSGDAAEITKLASLESREVLLAKLAGAMLASLSQAVYLLNAPLAQAARLAAALQQKAEQDPSVLSGAGATPVAEEAPASDED